MSSSIHRVQSLIADCLNVDSQNIHSIERLMGGRSNETYSFYLNDEKMTFRIPGKGGEVLTNFISEFENISRIEPLSMNAKTIFFDIQKGYKISTFIEGVELSSDLFFEQIEHVSNLLKRLHLSEISANNDYNPFERLTYYEQLVNQKGYKHSEEYSVFKEKFIKYYDFLSNQNKCFCHNDTQVCNMILNPDNALYLLDWEFAGNNDPLYDIACFGAENFDNAEKLLNTYLDNPQKSDFLRIYLWRVFQCLQWHNVATYKHLIGLSESLNLPFDEIATFYLSEAHRLYEKAAPFM